jgi:hypothetical protein
MILNCQDVMMPLNEVKELSEVIIYGFTTMMSFVVKNK